MKLTTAFISSIFNSRFPNNIDYYCAQKMFTLPFSVSTNVISRITVLTTDILRTDYFSRIILFRNVSKVQVVCLCQLKC